MWCGGGADVNQSNERGVGSVLICMGCGKRNYINSKSATRAHRRGCTWCGGYNLVDGQHPMAEAAPPPPNAKDQTSHGQRYLKLRRMHSRQWSNKPKAERDAQLVALRKRQHEDYLARKKHGLLPRKPKGLYDA